MSQNPKPADSGVQAWRHMIHAGHDQRRAAVRDLMTALGAPAATQDGWGFWRTPGGIVAYQLTKAHKPIPETRIEYPARLIDLLHSLLPPSLPTSPPDGAPASE